MPQREAGLLQHLPGIVGQRHLGIALEICRTHVGWIPSGALTAVTEQSHEFSVEISIWLSKRAMSSVSACLTSLSSAFVQGSSPGRTGNDLGFIGFAGLS